MFIPQKLCQYCFVVFLTTGEFQVNTLNDKTLQKIVRNYYF